MSISVFVQSLREAPPLAQVFNPWRDYDSVYDKEEKAPQVRCEHLTRYLTPRIPVAKQIWVAEAVGYQGGKFSGVPMTSERMLLGYHSTRPEQVAPCGTFSRTSSSVGANRQVAEKGYSEPTATIVWGALGEDASPCFDVIVWNIFPFHPFCQRKGPLSNRTPNEGELALGVEYLKKLLSLCQQNPRIILIGEKAKKTLGQGYKNVPHPANGGATRFRQGISPLLAELRETRDRA